ncbi:hypothetical protein CQW23_31063 [Capsicum baccatum]|uniref:Aminotransferase-like plant mobile domain-containing protein n=1 Tax=Capsicum baccatum TaxID=33114 RepID=A0A2G2V8P1_CAPBA|nr:hypothetical protein CQW23_31063 [Capsicum baccatum]
MMAHGENFSLAVLVLASICHDLWEISTSSKLGSFHALFPIHYVYGWIGLHLSFVTLRYDDLIMETYSPHRFSRQFGFYQDIPGILKKHHFDGSLLALVQLWDSCVCLGSLSKLNIPMRPLDNGPFMTQEYSDWWSAHRETMLRKNTHIILRGPKKNDTPSSTKGDELQLDGQGKLSISLKSKVVTDVYNNIFGDDVFSEDCITSPNPPSVLKSPNLSLDNVMTQASNKDPSAKLFENIESFQNIPTTDMVAEANDNRPSNSPKDLVFERSTSSTSLLWRFYLQTFLRSMESMEITRDAHQEFLSVAQHYLHAVNEDKVKIGKRKAELQKVLERADKELVAWTSKKKKTILLIDEHQKKFSKNQESVTNILGEIHALEKISLLSETETKELAKLKEITETSLLEILGHKLFP